MYIVSQHDTPDPETGYDRLIERGRFDRLDDATLWIQSLRYTEREAVFQLDKE